VRIFKSKPFMRFARRAQLSDADLGGGVIKQRIARTGGGKSGGYRTIILFRCGDRAYFVHGFAKNDKDNISEAELSHAVKSGLMAEI